MPAKPTRLAVLVDLDPEEPRLLGRVLARAAIYGPVAVRRVYGNCDKLRDWESCLQYHGIEPRANYGDGANAADITLIIDAVHLLLSGRADGFCILASDHHFTGLVRWLARQRRVRGGIGRHNASPELREAFGGPLHGHRETARPGRRLREGGARPGGEDQGRHQGLAQAAGRIRPPDDGQQPSGRLDVNSYCHGGLASLIDSYGEFQVRDGIYARIRPTPE